ncbi:MAG: cytochrome c3 family protein [Spirochaetota bacterium]|nr:cytochrome c3 family protein [Spirochaetota bacterium]
MKQVIIYNIIILLFSINSIFSLSSEVKSHLDRAEKMFKSDYLKRFKFIKTKKGPDQCINCHSNMPAKFKKPVEDFKKSVHEKAGITCVECHGGNSSIPDPSAMGDKFGGKPNGFIGKPKRNEIPILCSRCHSDPDYIKTKNPVLPVDQLEKYITSMHAKQLANGKLGVAVCSDCHNPHNILSHKEPSSSVYPVNVPKTCATCHNKAKMEKYGNTDKKATYEANQYNEYKTSIHGKLLLEKQKTSAPACNNCHGNHGAAPPGIDDVAMSCKQCHPVNAELFLQSKHSKNDIFKKSESPQCTSCHTKHSVYRPNHALIKTNTKCSLCHSEKELEDKFKITKGKGDSKFKLFEDQYGKQVQHENKLCIDCHAKNQTQNNNDRANSVKLMKNIITELGKQVKKVENELHTSENRGLGVSEAKFEFEKIKNIRTRLRTIHHIANIHIKIIPVDETYEGVIKEGVEKLSYKEVIDACHIILKKIEKKLELANDEYSFRRMWVAIATIIITFLVVMLILKIRNIEANKT